jgi:predicted LPLAT superfamily acyltransferase
MKLNDESNIASSDDFYDELIDLHRGLTDEQSAQLNARLILLLANHIGDMEVLRAAMVAARESAVEPQAAAPTNASRGS